MEETGFKAEAVWTDYSNRWFTLMHSTRPLIFKDYQEIAEHVSLQLGSFYVGGELPFLFGSLSS